MDGAKEARSRWQDAVYRLTLTVTTGLLLLQVPNTMCQTGMGQYAALPWSLLWLNPSYTGFYGGIGNVGQLTPDSAYLFGAGGQVGVGGVRGAPAGYNYGLGAYNHASRTTSRSHASYLALLAISGSLLRIATSLRR